MQGWTTSWQLIGWSNRPDPRRNRPFSRIGLAPGRLAARGRGIPQRVQAARIIGSLSVRAVSQRRQKSSLLPTGRSQSRQAGGRTSSKMASFPADPASRIDLAQGSPTSVSEYLLKVLLFSCEP